MLQNISSQTTGDSAFSGK